MWWNCICFKKIQITSHFYDFVAKNVFSLAILPLCHKMWWKCNFAKLLHSRALNSSRVTRLSHSGRFRFESGWPLGGRGGEFTEPLPRYYGGNITYLGTLYVKPEFEPRKWLANQSVQFELGSGQSSAWTEPTRTEPTRALLHRPQVFFIVACRFDEACRFEAARWTSPNISLAAYPGQRAQCQKNGLFPTLT